MKMSKHKKDLQEEEEFKLRPEQWAIDKYMSQLEELVQEYGNLQNWVNRSAGMFARNYRNMRKR